MTASVRSGRDQQAKRLHQPALLALDLANGEVEHALDRAQTIGRDRDLLAGHVVDLEAQDRDAFARGGG